MLFSCTSITRRAISRGSFVLAAAAAPLGCHILVDNREYALDEVSEPDAGHDSSGGGQGSDGGSGGDGGTMDGSNGPDCGASYHPDPIAYGQAHLGNIWAGDDNVYWIIEAVDGAPGRIMRHRRSNKQTTTLVADLSNPVGLRSAGNDRLVFTNDAGGAGNGSVGVFMVSKFGGPVTQLPPFDGLNAGALASKADDGFAVSEAWSRDFMGIRKSQMNGADPDCDYLYELPGPARISALATSDEGVFFADTSTDTIMRVGFECGSTAEPFALHQRGVRWMAAGNIRLYWITEDTAFRQEYTDDEPELLEAGLDDPTGITLINSEAVVTARGDGTVRNVITHEILACGQGGPSKIDSPDGSNTLFWTNEDSGEVMQLDLRTPM